MVVWLAAALAALDNQFDLSLHVAVVITSVTLLTVIEVGRYAAGMSGVPGPAPR